MGDIWNGHALLVFLAFFIPGFIGLQIWGLFIGSDEIDFAKQLPAVIGYSALHYAVTGWIILVAPDGPWRLAAIYVVVLVLPALWPFGILLLRDWEKWRKVFVNQDSGRLDLKQVIGAMLKPEQSPWDRVLGNRFRFIRIRLKSGRYVGGFMSKGSEVSTYPCERAIYIVSAYTFDENGVFGEPIDATGVLVQGSEIETLETIEVEEQEENV